jgi:hypothetical protein
MHLSHFFDSFSYPISIKTSRKTVQPHQIDEETPKSAKIPSTLFRKTQEV